MCDASHIHTCINTYMHKCIHTRFKYIQIASKRLILQTLALDHALATLQGSNGSYDDTSRTTYSSSTPPNPQNNGGSFTSNRGGNDRNKAGSAEASLQELEQLVARERENLERERQSTKALESRLEEVAELWKAATKEARDAKNEVDKYREDVKRAEARARDESLAAKTARVEAEQAESKAGAQVCMHVCVYAHMYLSMQIKSGAHVCICLE